MLTEYSIPAREREKGISVFLGPKGREGREKEERTADFRLTRDTLLLFLSR